MNKETSQLHYKNQEGGQCYAFLMQDKGLWSRREYLDLSEKNPSFRKVNLGTVIGLDGLTGFEPVFNTRYVLKEIKSFLESKMKEISRKPVDLKKPYSELLDWVDEAERVLLGRTV